MDDFRVSIGANISEFVKQMQSLGNVSNREMKKVSAAAKKTSDILANMNSQMKAGNWIGYAQGIGAVSLQMRTMIGVTTKSIPVLRGFGKALNSALGPIGIGITLITTFIELGESMGRVLGFIKDETEGATNATENFNKAQERQTKSHEALGSAIGESLAKFKLLQAEFAQLSTVSDKTKWINENKKAFEELGLKVSDVNDAYKVFVTRASSVISALKAIAEAEAYKELYTEAVKETATLRLKGYKYGNLHAGTSSAADLTPAERAEMSKLWENNPDAYWEYFSGFTKSGERAFSEKGANAAMEIRKRLKAQPLKDAQAYENKVLALYTQAEANAKKARGEANVFTNGGGGTPPPQSTAYTPYRPTARTKRYTAKPIDYDANHARLTDPNYIGVVGRLVDYKANMDNIQNNVTPEAGGLTDKEYVADLMETYGGLADNISGVAAAMAQLSDSTALRGTAIIAEAIANLALSFSRAMMYEGNKGVWNWIAAGAAGLTTLLTMTTQLKSAGAFATGGIVGGNSFAGDNLTAAVNSGEMILNRRQQSKLFNMIDRGSAAGGGVVDFRIQGQQLVGVLNNYKSRTSKF